MHGVCETGTRIADHVQTGMKRRTQIERKDTNTYKNAMKGMQM